MMIFGINVLILLNKTVVHLIYNGINMKKEPVCFKVPVWFKTFDNIAENI